MILTNARWQASTIEVTDCCMLLFHLGSSRVFSMIDHGTCTRSNNHTWLTNICPYGTKIRNLQHSLDQSFLNNLLNNGPIKRRCNRFFLPFVFTYTITFYQFPPLHDLPKSTKITSVTCTCAPTQTWKPHPRWCPRMTTNRHEDGSNHIYSAGSSANRMHNQPHRWHPGQQSFQYQQIRPESR